MGMNTVLKICYDLVILFLETHPTDTTAQVYSKSKQRGSVLLCFKDIKKAKTTTNKTTITKSKPTNKTRKYPKYLPAGNKSYIH